MEKSERTPMIEQEIYVETSDGFPLSAIVRKPVENPIGFIQINSGTGIPQRFYRHFAIYLAQKGYVTVTFDYRGIGGSRPRRLRGFEANNFQWGTLDMTAILDWGIQRYPDLEKIVIGHSMGGQLIGAMKNADKIDRTLIIASGTGYWREMPRSRVKRMMPLLWYCYIPLTANVLGFGAAKKINQGENLPKGVAMQWRNWCTSENYWERDFDTEVNAHSFARLQCDLHYISFTDDDFVSEIAREKLLSYYKNVNLMKQSITPKQMGVKQIGHFGFFSKKSEELWKLAAV